MADPATRHYNLRSSRQEGVHVLVEIQTSDDANFLMDLLARQKASTSGQVESDTLISETECDTLVNNSDPEQNSVKVPSQKQGSQIDSDPSTSSVSNISQQAINMTNFTTVTVIRKTFRCHGG